MTAFICASEELEVILIHCLLAKKWFSYPLEGGNQLGLIFFFSQIAEFGGIKEISKRRNFKSAVGNRYLLLFYVSVLIDLDF